MSAMQNSSRDWEQEYSKLQRDTLDVLSRLYGIEQVALMAGDKFAEPHPDHPENDLAAIFVLIQNQARQAIEALDP